MSVHGVGIATGSIPNPYLRRGRLAPASNSVFESLALDGGCRHGLRRKNLPVAAAKSPNLARAQVQSCHDEKSLVQQQQQQQQQYSLQQKQKQKQNIQRFEAQTNCSKNAYLKRGGRPPASNSVFESLGLDGAAHPRLNRPPPRAPPCVQTRHSNLEFQGIKKDCGAQVTNSVCISNGLPKKKKSGKLLNSLAIDAPARKTAHVPSHQLLARNGIFDGGVHQLGGVGHHIFNGGPEQLAGVGHHMQVCKLSMWTKALGKHTMSDANTDVDSSSAVHFQMHSSTCSMADTQEWNSESDWYSY